MGCSFSRRQGPVNGRLRWKEGESDGRGTKRGEPGRWSRLALGVLSCVANHTFTVTALLVLPANWLLPAYWVVKV